MKKGRIIAGLLLLIILACGCADKTPKTPKTETYIIPETFWGYTGTSPEEGVESIRKLGDDYYTDVKVVDRNVQVELTERQRENMIRRNDEYIAELAENFEKHNSEYRYVGDENYQKLDFYFDEKIPDILHVKTLFGISGAYGLNYVLKNHDTEWQVDLKIYNCHTNKIVATVDVPNETVTYGPAEWKASYDE